MSALQTLIFLSPNWKPATLIEKSLSNRSAPSAQRNVKTTRPDAPPASGCNRNLRRANPGLTSHGEGAAARVHGEYGEESTTRKSMQP
ncbi:MAG: hypothetical protein M9920_02955 [Verrucomicrobiae bacterium]|nr:hypothetical protein [Verrucomicrobiae bacterium]